MKLTRRDFIRTAAGAPFLAGYRLLAEPEKGRYLHPSAHRPITIREAARCMSFPDDFHLPTDQPMPSIARRRSLIKVSRWGL